MSKDLKERFYSEQFPELLEQLRRIADALEMQVGRENAQPTGQVAQDGERVLRRQKFKEQLEKLAEVDRMARELRRKLEEKQAEEAAARTRLEETTNATDSAKASEETSDPSDEPPVPTNN